MDRRCVPLMLLAVMVALSPSLFESSEADGVPDAVHYCYGDIVHLAYPYDDGAQISWEGYVVTTSGDRIPLDEIGDDIHLDVTDASLIHVVQTATLGLEIDTKTIEVRPVHLSADTEDDDGVYTIRFLDGSREVQDPVVIDGETSIEYGVDRFFDVPAAPGRSGYTFLGWYHQDGSGKEVRMSAGEEYEPVYGDRDYYAKWVANGTGGDTPGGDPSGPVIVEETYTVTFETEPGLYYTLNSKGSGFVNFTVSVYDGFHYRDVTASADAGVLDASGMVYTLSGIDSDVTVTISGDRLFAVAYHVPDGTVVSAAGYGDSPGLVSGGPLLMTVDGPESMEVFVFMGSRDVSADCVRGDVISIAEVTGDILVLVNDTTPDEPAPGPDTPDTPEGPAEDRGEPFPWWIVAILMAAVAAMLLAYIVLRQRS